MIATTQAWKDYSVNGSNYKPYIMVVKNNAPIWVFDSTHIAEGSLKFTDEICTPGNFDLGACVSNSFECDIINFDHSFPSPEILEDAVVRLYFSLSDYSFDASSTAVVGLAIVGNAIVGHRGTAISDTIRRGTYRLDPVKKVGRTVHISGSDFMADTRFNSADIDGYDFTGRTCMSTLVDLGFPIVSNFPYSNWELPSITVSEEYGFAQATKRSVLEYIAQICGCYARFNTYGALELKPFSTSGTVTNITKIMNIPDVDYYHVEVTGLYASGYGDVYADVGEDGYYMFIDKNPFITTGAIAAEVASRVFAMVNGLSVVPFSITYIADPSLEAGDLVSFTYNGNTTTSMVMSFQYGLQQHSNISLEVDTSEHYNADILLAAIPETAKATYELYNGDVLKKIINYSGQDVQLEADQININGVISANGTFRVNADGSVEIQNGGTIGGFNIGQTALYNGMDSLDSEEQGVYVGTDGIGLGGGLFAVDEEGNLTTKSGHIGAWDIDQYGLRTMNLEYAGEHTDKSPTFHMLFRADTTASTSWDLQYQYPLLLEMVDPTEELPIMQVKSLFRISLTGNVDCVSLTQTSDRRTKEDIEYLDQEDSAARVYRFKPCSYRSKVDKQIHRGFIAQDLEADIEGWVPVNENERGIKNIAYTELIADLVATIQSQNSRIKALEYKIEGLYHEAE